jgi:hypothetical protein
MRDGDLSRLLERGALIREAIAGITSMRRGTLNEIFHYQKLKDGTMARRGPFYNITFKTAGNKTVTTAVPKKDLERIRGEVENYKSFRVLCDEYIDVCEKISSLSQQEDKQRD